MTTYVFNVSFERDGDGWRAFYTPLEHIGASTWGKTQEEALQHIQGVANVRLADGRLRHAALLLGHVRMGYGSRFCIEMVSLQFSACSPLLPQKASTS